MLVRCSYSVRLIAVEREERRVLPVSITEDSRAGWQLFANAQGVSVAAFIEALGLALADVDRPAGVLRRAVDEARRIDTARRRRSV